MKHWPRPLRALDHKMLCSVNLGLLILQLCINLVELTCETTCRPGRIFFMMFQEPLQCLFISVKSHQWSIWWKPNDIICTYSQDHDGISAASSKIKPSQPVNTRRTTMPQYPDSNSSESDAANWEMSCNSPPFEDLESESKSAQGTSTHQFEPYLSSDEISSENKEQPSRKSQAHCSTWSFTNWGILSVYGSHLGVLLLYNGMLDTEWGKNEG